MTTIKTTTENLVSNILGGNQMTEEKKTATKTSNTNKKVSKRKEQMENPQNISILLPYDVFMKLQHYMLEEKMNGNRSFSISSLGRELIEDWVKKNC